MARFSLRQGSLGGLAVFAASALWLGCAGAPAWAGDDGAAPIWVGLGKTLGLGQLVGVTNDEPAIDYRDRPRLVLPPKMELPPPAVSPTASALDWPIDPDVEAAKKAQAERNKIAPRVGTPKRGSNETRAQDESALVTTNYTAGMGPGRDRCPVGQSCNTPTGPQLNWNPLTWVGVQKKPQTVLGPEPERTSLTDPPTGYRAPAEGVGVKIDNN